MQASGSRLLDLLSKHQACRSCDSCQILKVDDSGTQALMTVFYNQLKQGKIPLTEALRRSQIHLIKSDLKHPFYWSAFILIGNGF
ncbi:MAG: CHAT domain-containing protein [Microcoleus sp. SU_5_6]|nr:CHAT domain-containing protein [Microcoleus sp. SU_5_6]